MIAYHFVPENMEGAVLMPLNQLKHEKPHLYEKHMRKYAGLKEQDVKIPGFGYWNDCLNLMPVNPGSVKAELEKFGHDTNWRWRFFEIPINKLNISELIFLVPLDKNDASKRSIEHFTKEKYEKYGQALEVARHRYKIAKLNGEEPFTFGGIPHLLYKGRIDTTTLSTVEF